MTIISPVSWSQKTMHKFGYNPDIDANEEDIWDAGSDWVAPAAAVVHKIASTSSSDKAGEAGALTVTIYGLDSSYDQQSETVTLTGTSDATTANAYLRIHRMFVATASDGGLGYNKGNITATTSDVAGTVTAQITAQNNQSLMAIYTIPNGTIGALSSYYASVDKTTSAQVNIRLYIRPQGGVWQVKHQNTISSTGSSYIRHEWSNPILIDSKSDIKITGDSSAATNTGVSAGFDVICGIDLDGNA